MIHRGLRIGGFSNPTVHEITAEGVKPWPGAPLPPGRSAFQHFFAPVFPYLDSVFLLSGSEGSPFAGGFVSETGDAEEMDAELARWIVDVPMDGSLPPQVLEQPRPILHRPGVVSAGAHTFYDDWWTLIDLGPTEDEAVRIATTLVHLELDDTSWEENRARFRGTVLAEARSVMQCIDGLLWDFYTKDASLLEVVEKHARASGPYTVTAVPLEECLKW